MAVLLIVLLVGPLLVVLWYSYPSKSRHDRYHVRLDPFGCDHCMEEYREQMFPKL